MKRKAFWIALLACVNAALLSAIVLTTWSPKQALAQGMGLNGNYLMVAGHIQNTLDSLYLIDTRQRTLHAFIYEKGKNTLQWADMRDLEADSIARQIFRQSRGDHLQNRKDHGTKGSGCAFVLRQAKRVVRRVVISADLQYRAVLEAHKLQSPRIRFRLFCGVDEAFGLLRIVGGALLLFRHGAKHSTIGGVEPCTKKSDCG